MRVLRVALAVTDYQTIALPIGSKILQVASTPWLERLDLWYWEREPDQRRYDVGIYIVGDGETMHPALRQYGFHIGTCVMYPHLVRHVFEGPVQR